MNFNVYLNKSAAQRVNKMAKAMKRSRNSIITEALDEWLNHHETKNWPKGFFNFEPIHDVPDFKKLRDELTNNIPEDPLE